MATSAPAAAGATAALPSRTAPAATLTIFGAAGDLTKRLVVPALYHLVRAGKLPDGFSIIGVDIADQTTEVWRQHLTEMMRSFTGEAVDEQAWEWLAGRMHYVQGDITKPEAYRQLAALLAEHGARQGAGANVLFYLAVADRFFAPVIEQLGRAGLVQQSHEAWRRVIIEKPFGHDLASAEALNAQILKVLSARIRSIGSIISSARKRSRTSWCCASPTASSSRSGTASTSTTSRSPSRRPSGSSAAASSTRRTGALRDMVPNHLFQLLAMIAMEPPISFDADAVRAKKTELFQAIHPIVA